MHARFNSRHDKSSSEFKLTVVYFSNTRAMSAGHDWFLVAISVYFLVSLQVEFGTVSNLMIVKLHPSIVPLMKRQPNVRLYNTVHALSGDSYLKATKILTQ